MKNVEQRLDYQKVVVRFLKNSGQNRTRMLEAFYLRVAEEMTYRQIADEMGVCTERARQLVHSAQRKLNVTLVSMGFEKIEVA